MKTTIQLYKSLALIFAILFFIAGFMAINNGQRHREYKITSEKEKQAYRDSIATILQNRTDTINLYLDSLNRIKIADSILIKNHGLKRSYIIALPSDSLDSLFRATYPDR